MECLHLVDLLGTDAYRYSYIIQSTDPLSESQIRVPGPVYRVIRPSYIKQRRIVRDTLKFALCTLQATAILVRARPDAVISTGPAVAVPVCLAAKVVGAAIVFIETGSRVRRLSTTGKIMRHLADLFFVQWEELLPAAPRGAIFAGRLC